VSTVEDLFHPVVELPEPVRADRYRRLVGVDDIKDQLRREAQLLAHPGLLRAWAAEHHPAGLPALALFTDRAPLFVFAGDVGCGKTALAESFGCDLAESLDLPVFLYRLKLTARGSGLVGEMTTLIGDAFAYLLAQGRKARGASGPGSVFILVVDEADALAQSRAAEQMHHEDRAGVDALLAGVDSLAGEAVPVLVIMCTNRKRPWTRRSCAAPRRSSTSAGLTKPSGTPSWPTPSPVPGSTPRRSASSPPSPARPVAGPVSPTPTSPSG
jgi:SpoVK/Ycf46/Vps4 family AAA+-type ATPase